MQRQAEPALLLELTTLLIETEDTDSNTVKAQGFSMIHTVRVTQTLIHKKPLHRALLLIHRLIISNINPR